MQKGRTLKDLTFNQGRVTKTGKMIPLSIHTLEPHNCDQNPYNQQQKQQKTSGAQKAEPLEAVELVPTIRALEVQELNRKLDLITKQLTALCQKYDVIIDVSGCLVRYACAL